jgi:dipeptidyl aminopeptidase/acylaminoacyl peptidase
MTISYCLRVVERRSSPAIDGTAKRSQIARRPISVAALMFASLCGLCDNAASRAPHSVSLDDLQRLKRPDELQLSPDGGALVFTLVDHEFTLAVNRGLWLVDNQAGSVPRKIGEGFLPTWSPDGRRLAYYSSQLGAVQLWVFDLKSNWRRQMTRFDAGVDPDPTTMFNSDGSGRFAYAWSPDSTRLVFASRVATQAPLRGHATSTRLARAQPQAPLVLTNDTPPSWTLFGVFSHGFGLAHYTRGKLSIDNDLYPLGPPEALTSQLFIADARDGTVRQITHDNMGYFNPDWSPTGGAIVCASLEGRSLGFATGDTNIYLVDALTGNRTALTTGSGAKWLPHWSPDGRRIAYLERTAFGGAQSVFMTSAKDTLPVNVTTRLDRDIQGFQWFPDGQSVGIQFRDGVLNRIAQINVSTGNIMSTIEPDSAAAPLLTVSKSGAVAWERSEPSGDGIVRIRGPADTSSHVILDLNPQIKDWKLGEQAIVRWKNKRGDEMEGVLIKPPGYTTGSKLPLIVDCYTNQPNGFKGHAMWGNQAWASMGYAVFFPNPRAPHAPTGHFKDEASNHAARTRDGWAVTLDDVTSGVDELIRRAVIDPDRMCLYGFSNGGGVVNYLVSKTHRFKCAVSVAGALSDWIRPELLEPDVWIKSFEIARMNPYNSPEALAQLSAVFHTNDVTTPMLLADGDSDGDFLLNTIEMYNGLRRFGVDVTLLRYPKQGHGFTGAAMGDFWQREMAFFDKYLKPSLPH